MRQFLTRYRSVLLLILKLGVTAALLWYFITQINWADVWGSFRQMNPQWLAPLALVLFLRYVAFAERFTQLTRGIFSIPRGRLISHYVVMQWASSFLPAVVGGDGVRWVLLRREGIAKADAAIYVIIERLLGLLSLALLSGIFMAYLPTASALPWSLRVGVWAGALAGVLVLLYALCTRLWLPLPAMLRPAVQALRDRPWNAVLALAGTLVLQVLSVLVTWIIAQALGISVGLGDCLMFVPLVWIGIALPISFGGLGVREALFVWLFGMVGLSEAASLSLSLGTYAAFVVGALPGAFLWWGLRK